MQPLIEFSLPPSHLFSSRRSSVVVVVWYNISSKIYNRSFAMRLRREKEERLRREKERRRVFVIILKSFALILYPPEAFN